MAERRWPREAVRHAILVAAVVAMGLPFVEMLAVSLAAPSTVFSGELLPAPDWRAAVANYGVALTGVPLVRYMGNGVVVCAAILVLQVLIAAPAGYALAKLRFGLRPVLFAAVIVGLLVPMQIPAIPMYLAIARAGLLDSYTALVLPFIVSVFAIFLFRQFFMTYPGRNRRCSQAGRLLGAFHRVAIDAAGGQAGGGGLRLRVGHRALERSLLAARRHHATGHDDAGARHRGVQRVG